MRCMETECLRGGHPGMGGGFAQREPGRGVMEVAVEIGFGCAATAVSASA